MALMIAGFIGIGSLQSADWPVYQHDNRRSGHSIENLPATQLGEDWTYHSSLAPHQAWYGPAKWDAYAGIRGLKSMRNYDPAFHVTVAGHSLFFGSSADDSVHCLDSRTAVEKWRFVTDGPVRIAPSYLDGKLYFGSDDGHAYCIDAETGRLIWKFSPSPEQRQTLHNGRFISFWPCRTGVLLDGGTAYFATGLLPWKQSFLCAVDAQTGRPEGPGRFVRQLDGVTFEGALLASNERLISPQGRVAPLLFEKKDGRPLGSLEGGGGCFVLVTEDSHVLHGPGNKTGWIQESSETDRSKIATIEGGNAMIVRGNIAYVLTDDTVVAMDRKDRKELWRHTGSYPFSIILAGDALYAGGKDAVVALSADDGRVLWRGAVSGRAYGLAVADGALFASTDEGTIHSFRPKADAVATPIAALPSSATPDKPLEPVQPVLAVNDPDLLGRWVFQEDQINDRDVRNLAGNQDGTVIGKTTLMSVEGMQVLQLNGKSQSVLVTANLKSRDLPVQQMTAEAWVRVNQVLEWGGIIGAIQDDGDVENGWLLGYRDRKFAFAIAGKEGSGRLTYITAGTEFELGRWYHVMGTYDGQEARLYVNGTLSQTSTLEKGPIRYPDRGFYEIGAYHDANEHYRMNGMLREVRVYGRSLAPAEAAAHARENAIQARRRFELAAGPILEFTGLDGAVVRWETNEPVPTLLEWGTDETDMRTISDDRPKTRHTAILKNLGRHRTYQYVVKGLVEGELLETSPYECDTFFNYNLPPVPTDSHGSDQQHSRVAEDILHRSGVTAGICLLLGSDNGKLGLELARRSEMRVVVVDTDLARIEATRKALQPSGVYGARVAARWVASFSEIPFTQSSVNLIVSNPFRAADQIPEDVAPIAQLLRPDGGVALLGASSDAGAVAAPARASAWIQSARFVSGVAGTSTAPWARFDRGALPGTGKWSHQYGTADNSAFGGESLMGASRTEEFEVQWMGRPGPRAQPDRNGRKPSPLSANGRLFVQGLHRVIGLDAHNGSVLWSREIPALQRFNMPRDCSNWCVDEENVYIAIDGRCLRFDAATGQVSKEYNVLPGAETASAHEWSYISIQGDQLIGSTIKQGNSFTDYWGGSDAGWYDATSGPATYKVCSEQLFSLDRQSGETRWIYRNGRIINSTLSISDDHAYFVECRNAKVLASPSDRVGLPELWENLFLVNLDVRTGKVVWEEPIAPVAGEVVFYMACGTRALALVSSGSKAYHVYTHGLTDGKPLWNISFDWLKDNHGGHMARPAIVGNTLYVRPQVFDLLTGVPREQTIPGGGCGTYAATLNALFFRNSNVTVWSAEGGESSSWSRLRPDCWLSTIPAAGLLLSPEAGGGCSCGSWMETSLAFAPIVKFK
ncbi:MAG: PQQ-binding-like beta-propeller repeat protein [Verrucomicrobia bacterium]|nr:PQQ-binding-like beta-propeller repeat protein [Verrucomicrobiota bacterium]